MGDINALFRCWQEHPYHLPMLLQLSQAFHITGDTANTNLFMDLSLHVAGMLLSSGGGAGSSVVTPTSPSASSPIPSVAANFALGKTPRDRVLPYRFPANKPVFVALCRGMHSALRQGSAHTAHEMCKALLSLDEEDPEGAALMLDVTAIRSREWLYLIELHHRLVFHALRDAAGRPEGTATGGAVDADSLSAFVGGTQQATPVPTGLEWVALPSIHFNAALARHMYASNVGASASSTVVSGKGGDKVKGNRTVGTLAQRALVQEGGGSGSQTPVGGAPAPLQFTKGSDLFGRQTEVKALAIAIGLFPQAALCLAEAIEEKMSNDPWMPLTFCYEDIRATVSAGLTGPYVEATNGRLSKLFALGSKAMWKSTQHAKLLRDAASLAVKEDLVARFHTPKCAPAAASASDLVNAPFDVAASALGAAVKRITGTILHDRYAALPEENVTGVFASQIPQELLDAGEEEAHEGHFERVPEAEAQLLRRYEAAFGALPGNLRFADRMEEYGRRLEERVRQLGRDEGAVTMFLRTMLPWNDVNEMALRQAFGEAGVEDPAVVARRLQRQHEWEVMNRADALALDEDLPEDQQ
eukprot:GILI01015776.1.p1 GENE.GILI01015776.1~~GILI01015776.1.p1  ORF type:complete len:625 (-),score=151.45 GILI01015776.1:144-1898(-)